MVNYKNITIKKRGGGTRKQRVRVLKSGKFKFVKNLGKKLRKSNPRAKKPRKVRRKVARKKRRRRSGMTIPVAPLIGFAGPILEAYSKWGPTVDAVNYYSQSMTGYDFIGGTFDIQRAKRGLMPLVIGMLIHKFVGGAPLNLNRTLAASKIPFLRI